MSIRLCVSEVKVKPSLTTDVALTPPPEPEVQVFLDDGVGKLTYSEGTYTYTIGWRDYFIDNGFTFVEGQVMALDLALF